MARTSSACIEVRPGRPAAIDPRSGRSRATPIGLPDAPDEIFASMGNYASPHAERARSRPSTRDAPDPKQQARPGRQHHPDDGGRGAAAPRCYDFGDNDVPGSTERDRGYWRDVGTLDAYYDAHMDLISPHPVFNLYNDRLADLRRPRTTAAGQVRATTTATPGRPRATRLMSGRWWIISAGLGAAPRCCSPRRDPAQPRARSRTPSCMGNVEACIGGAHRPAACRHRVDKNVVVPDGARIGFDLEEDRERLRCPPDDGVVVIGKNEIIDR